MLSISSLFPILSYPSPFTMPTHPMSLFLHIPTIHNPSRSLRIPPNGLDYGQCTLLLYLLNPNPIHPHRASSNVTFSVRDCACIAFTYVSYNLAFLPSPSPMPTLPLAMGGPSHFDICLFLLHRFLFLSHPPLSVPVPSVFRFNRAPLSAWCNSKRATCSKKIILKPRDRS